MAQSPSAVSRSWVAALNGAAQLRQTRYSLSYSPGTQRPLSIERRSHSLGLALRSVVVLWHPIRAKAVISKTSRRIAFPSSYVRVRTG